MQFHELPKRKLKHKRRVGRGGKRGTFSGRGTKGQRSRAGRRIRPAERDLIIRLPKRRGFRNKPLSVKPIGINLGRLDQLFGVHNGIPAVVDRAHLVAVGVVSPRDTRDIKILGNGNALSAIHIKGFRVSRSARAKIEKAGGKVE